MTLIKYLTLSSFSLSLCLLFNIIKVDKVVQLYETMLTRHSTMLVGPTGGGKTVVLETLVKAQTTMGMPTKCITLNPKVKSGEKILCTLLIESVCV